MRAVEIMRGKRWSITSYGNGWGYAIVDHVADRSLWLQDEAATMFREELEAEEAIAPTRDVDATLRVLFCAYQIASGVELSPDA